MSQRSNNNRLPANEKHPREMAFVLRMGKWRHAFNEYQYKSMVAVALNACTDQDTEEFWVKVAGYLITGKRLVIVWKIVKGEPERIFHFFETRLRAEIRKMKKYLEEEQRQESGMPEIDLHEKLFEKHLLYRDHLVEIITGQPVDLPYYDPQLARLKAYLHHENFCSVLDYTGAKSPVIVDIKTNHK